VDAGVHGADVAFLPGGGSGVVQHSHMPEYSEEEEEECHACLHASTAHATATAGALHYVGLDVREAARVALAGSNPSVMVEQSAAHTQTGWLSAGHGTEGKVGVVAVGQEAMVEGVLASVEQALVGQAPVGQETVGHGTVEQAAVVPKQWYQEQWWKEQRDRQQWDRQQWDRKQWDRQHWYKEQSERQHWERQQWNRQQW
jgi:hypothetical protein